MQLEQISKNETRKYVSKAYEAFAQTYNRANLVVTLPEKNWILEKEIAQRTSLKQSINTNLICYERDVDVYASNLLDGSVCYFNSYVEDQNHIPILDAQEYVVNNKDECFYTTLYANSFNFDYRLGELPPVNHLKVFNKPTFVWYDLCGVPSEQNLSLIGDAEVAAFTFCLSKVHIKDYNLDYQDPLKLEKEISSRLANGKKKPTLLHSLYYQSKREPMLLVIYTKCKEVEKAYKKLNKELISKPKTVSSSPENQLTSKQKAEIRKEFKKFIKLNSTKQEKKVFRLKYANKFNVTVFQIAGVTNYVKL